MDQVYKLLLVDDEDEIRGRIASLIFESSGFKVVGKAGNGHDAYELIETLNPDVILTDIKMPFIDGIELAKLVRRDYPTIKIAFISGYDEFKYAQAAIHLNVFSYLMKPVSSKDINVFLQRLKTQLDDDYQRKFNLDSALKNYKESLPLIINHTLVNLLINSDQSELHLKKLSECGFDLNHGHYMVCLFEVENHNEDTLLSLEKIRILIDEIFNQSISFKIFKHHFIIQNKVLLLLKFSQNPLLKEMDVILYEVIQNVEQFMELRVRVGISSIFDDLTYLSNAFSEATQANQYGKLLNTGRIIYIHEFENRETKHFNLSLSDIKHIENLLKFGTIEEITAYFSLLKSQLKHDKDIIIFHDLFIINLSHIIMSFSNSIFADTSDLIKPGLLHKMLSFSDLDLLFDWTLSLLLSLRKRNYDSNLSKADEILQKAYQHVDKNYNDPNLSLNSICDALDISVSYLSMLIKKSNALSLNKYLIKVRMEKAQELLATTHHKIIDISLMVGYHDVYYFSHSFKKYTDKSPKQFREVYDA